MNRVTDLRDRVCSPGIVGRSDLETLLASTDPQDWVRISQRLLGPPPPGFVFAPKHKVPFPENIVNLAF